MHFLLRRLEAHINGMQSLAAKSIILSGSDVLKHEAHG